MAVPGIDVFGHRMLDKALGCDHLELPGVDLLLHGDAKDAAEVVHVAVGVDHRDDRAVAPVRPVEGECRGRRFRGHQRVDDDDSRLALNERAVGKVEATYLVDALGDLIKPCLATSRD